MFKLVKFVLCPPPQTPGQLARTVEMTLADMVGRFQNVVFDKYRF